MNVNVLSFSLNSRINYCPRELKLSLSNWRDNNVETLGEQRAISAIRLHLTLYVILHVQLKQSMCSLFFHY